MESSLAAPLSIFSPETWSMSNRDAMAESKSTFVSLMMMGTRECRDLFWVLLVTLVLKWGTERGVSPTPS